MVISVEVTDYYNVQRKIERGGAGGKEREKFSTLHIFFDNLYNLHCILQYKNDTIKFTPKVALRHAILYMIYAYNLLFACKQCRESRNGILGIGSRWESEKYYLHRGWGSRFFSYPKHPDHLWAHPASYSMQRRGSIPEGNANGALANQ